MSAVINDLGNGFEIHWYRIESVLGRGGFGITYLARDRNLDKHVAIKEYLPHDFAKRGDDSTVQPVSQEYKSDFSTGLGRFMKEAKTLAKFKHPNIAHVTSCFELNNTGYMVMEYEHGRPLNEIYEEKNSLTQPELEDIYYPVIDGLSLVHHAGFIHRDIKPSNIYIRNDGSPVLIDFGAARQTVGPTNVTLTAMLTEGYAPSEQYHSNSDEQGPWTDIYALGACLYQGIAGAKPVSSTERTHDISTRNSDPLRPLSHSGITGCDPVFLRAIDQALRVNFHDRPQSLEDFLGMLKGEIALPDLTVDAGQNPDNSNDGPTVVKPGRRTIPDTGVDIENDTQRKNRQPGSAPASGQDRKTRGSQSKLLLAIGVITAMAVIAYFLMSAKNTQQETLLDKAAKLIAAGNYHDEKGTGAYGTYQKILEIEPGNAGAIQGIETVRDHFLQQAESYMQESKLVEAGASLKIAKAAAPAYPGLKDAQGKLSDLLRLKQIELYLSKAQASLEQGRAYRPESDNAMIHFRTVLKLDAENVTARLGLAEVANIIIGEARDALESNKIQRAESLIELATSIDSDQEAIREIRQQIINTSKLATLVAAADRAYARTRYTTPSNENAFDLYNQVLDLEPSNRHAQQQLDNIADYYAARVRRFTQSGSMKNANANIGVLESYFPAFPGLVALRREIIKKQIEIKPPEPPKIIAATPSRLLPVDVDQQQGDKQVVQDIVGLFLNAFQKQDINRLSNVAQLTRRQQGLYTQIFETYKTITINLVPNTLSLDRNGGVATARFEITELIDRSGDTVLAGAGWGKLKLKIFRQNGDWLKAEIE